MERGSSVDIRLANMVVVDVDSESSSLVVPSPSRSATAAPALSFPPTQRQCGLAQYYYNLDNLKRSISPGRSVPHYFIMMFQIEALSYSKSKD